MSNAYGILAALWLLFAVYWIISAAFSKKNARGFAWWRWAGLRALIVFVTYYVAVHTTHRRHMAAFHQFHHPGAVAGPLGVAICSAGFAFAVWARVHIGRNWGMPMSVKENPELVASGPYALVRHPIYTGLLTALLGSVLVSGIVEIVIFIALLIYFIYCAKTEERLMTAQFPTEYPAYKNTTKFLIPYLW